jgi:hypothetical protein
MVSPLSEANPDVERELSPKLKENLPVYTTEAERKDKE